MFPARGPRVSLIVHCLGSLAGIILAMFSHVSQSFSHYPHVLFHGFSCFPNVSHDVPFFPMFFNASQWRDHSSRPLDTSTSSVKCKARNLFCCPATLLPRFRVTCLAGFLGEHDTNMTRGASGKFASHVPHAFSHGFSIVSQCFLLGAPCVLQWFSHCFHVFQGFATPSKCACHVVRCITRSLFHNHAVLGRLGWFKKELNYTC